jgi:hypothetical protein
MTAAPGNHPSPRHLPRAPRPHSRAAGWTTAASAALLALALLAAGCGGSGNPGLAGPGSAGSNQARASSGSSGALLARFLAYTHCMRSHGVHDFPDPNTSGGGIAFEIHGGPGSDLNRTNPTFERATRTCRSLDPVGAQPPPQSAAKIAIEVKWARCMRSHGLPNFPDPNSQGAFDSSKFDENSPAFQAASNACKALDAEMGPTPVVPGRG